MSTPNQALDRTEPQADLTSPEEMLERLLAFEPVPAPVLSLYLDGRADQHGRQNFLPFARKQLTERGKFRFIIQNLPQTSDTQAD